MDAQTLRTIKPFVQLQIGNIETLSDKEKVAYQDSIGHIIDALATEDEDLAMGHIKKAYLVLLKVPKFKEMSECLYLMLGEILRENEESEYVKIAETSGRELMPPPLEQKDPKDPKDPKEEEDPVEAPFSLDIFKRFWGANV